MGIGRQTVWALALAAQVGSAGQEAKGRLAARETVELLVGVHNYAGMPQATVARAEEHAAQVLDRAGIAVRWVECPVAAGDEERNLACLAVKERLGLFLKILPETMARGFRNARAVFGLAIHPNTAYVFADRVTAGAAHLDLPDHAVLGAVMIHELGHLLLGEGGHVDNGIMSEDLRGKLFRLVAQGSAPRFDAAQVRRIHARLAERVRSER